MAWLWLSLTMPYHAYAPLPHWPVTPSPSPSRVSSVTFCVCVCSRKFMQLPGCRQDQEEEKEKEEEDAGLAAWLAFYFILFALITSPATLLKNIFACWEISRSLFHAPGAPRPTPPSATPLQGVQGHGMARSRTCSRAGRRLGKCIRFARAVNVKTMAQVFGCQLRKGKCAGKIA